MNHDHQEDFHSRKPKRPFSVTVLILVVLSITIVHLVRFVQAIQQWGFLQAWMEFSPLYQALTGMLWFAAGLWLAWGLWRGRDWAPLASRIAIPAYLAYAWIDRIFVANPAISQQPGSSWPCLAGVTLFFLVFIIWVFSRSKVKAFFRRDHDRASQS